MIKCKNRIKSKNRIFKRRNSWKCDAHEELCKVNYRKIINDLLIIFKRFADNSKNIIKKLAKN